MDLRRDQLQVLEHFSKALSADKSRPQIAQLTELGLIELTRKRQGKNLYELFGQACPTCAGLGLLVRLPGEAVEAEGEMIERPSGIALRERQERPERAPLETRGFWEDRSEEGEESEDGPDFNSRPPSLPDANRRRRRRPGGDEPTLRIPGLSPATKDFNIDPEPFASTDDAAFGGRSGRPERGGRGRGRRGGGRELPALGGVRSEFSAPQPAVTENSTLPEPSFPKSTGVEVVPAADGSAEDRRGRGRRDRKPPSEPPELISVEMTPDEQDVYAWMGISPLVLTNQDVKNPKSALISVVLPGQAPLLEAIATSAEPTAVVELVEEVPTPDLPPPPAPIKLTLPPPTPKATRVIESAPVTLPPAIEPVLKDEPLPEAEEAEEGPVRRRRRRSSAQADGA